MIQSLNKIYGDIYVHKRETHYYLSMCMAYNMQQKSVNIDMWSYIDGCIDEFEQNEPDVQLKPVTMPDTENLFRVRDEGGLKLLSWRIQTFILWYIDGSYAAYYDVKSALTAEADCGWWCTTISAIDEEFRANSRVWPRHDPESW